MLKEPSELKIYSSSKKTALAVTPAASIDHHSPLPALGPTLKAPASGLSFHLPANGDGSDGFL